MDLTPLAGPVAEQGYSVSLSADEQYLAKLAGPIDLTAKRYTGLRWWRGAYTYAKRDKVSGLEVWTDSVNGKRLTSRSTTHATKLDTYNINSRPTLRIAGATSYSAAESEFALDDESNTLYSLIRLHSGVTGLEYLFGVKDAVTAGGEALDVFAGGFTLGVPRQLFDTGTTSSLIHTAAGDLRGTVFLRRDTMGPSYGRSITIWNTADPNGLTVQNTAQTAPLSELSFTFGGFADVTGRLQADIAEVLLLTGVDHMDPLYAGAAARVPTILKSLGGIV